MPGKDLSAKLARTADHARLEAVRRLSPAAERLTREYLCTAYLDEERDICAIAREVGCRPGTVLFHLAVYGIPLRPPLLRTINPLTRPRGSGRRVNEPQARPPAPPGDASAG
jgi:hypothetical protein